jgi:hypothetical protein
MGEASPPGKEKISPSGSLTCTCWTLRGRRAEISSSTLQQLQGLSLSLQSACTFRSPYLCNIGCRADGGALSEIPQRLRLHVQAALHRRRQQITRSTPSKHTTVRACASQGGSHPLFGSKEPFHALAPLLFPQKGKRAPPRVLAIRASKPCIVSAWKASTKGERSAHPVEPFG